jgi:hypothetical protein
MRTPPPGACTIVFITGLRADGLSTAVPSPSSILKMMGSVAHACESWKAAIEIVARLFHRCRYPRCRSEGSERLANPIQSKQERLGVHEDRAAEVSIRDLAGRPALALE